MSLSTQVRFFQTLSVLEKDCSISAKQKHQLKIALTLKDPRLINLLASNGDADEEEMKFSILSYVKQTEHTTHEPKRKPRSQSSVMELNQFIKRQRKLSTEDQKELNEDVLEKIKIVNDILLIYNTKVKEQQFSNDEVNQSLNALIKIAKKVQQVCEEFRPELHQNSPDIEDKIPSSYKKVKAIFSKYMQSHLLMMDQNISYTNLFQLLKDFIHQLLDCDEFSFIYKRRNQAEYYSTESDSFKNIVIEEKLLNELNLIESQSVIEIGQQGFYQEISKSVQNHLYQRSFLAKIEFEDNLEEEYFIAFHQKQGKVVTKGFLNIVNRYFFFDAVKQLSLFLIETVKQARVQFFSPLSIADMIQDVGLAFVKCSKYLLIEQFNKQLQKKYQVDIVIQNPSISQNSINTSSPMKIFDTVQINFKDDLDIKMHIKQMDLNKKNHLEDYKNVIQYYDKYQMFINQCFDKTAYYKFFLRSNDSLIFEFEKTGQLRFLSKPIPQAYKDMFKIEFDQSLVRDNELGYQRIFKNNAQLLSDIENHLQDISKWKIEKEEKDNNYAIFTKTKEKSFKGFVIIFQDSAHWIKNKMQQLSFLNIDDQMRKSFQNTVLEQETMNYIKNLEKNVPDFKTSTVSLFMPENKRQDGNQILKLRSLLVQKELIQKAKSIEKKEKELLNSLSIEWFNFEHKALDDEIDKFSFDILSLQDNSPLELCRIVWALFDRNGYFERFKISTDKFSNFLQKVERKYNRRKNTFHNFQHGVTVMQCTHAINLKIQESQYKNLLDDQNQLCLILSGLCHDLDHTGRTNMFEINSLSKLAIRYHDKSVLENHHAATAINILTTQESQILQNMPSDKFRQFRKMLISNILYTDITDHFKLVKLFEQKSEEKSWGQNEDDVKILSGFILHTSDFSGGAKPFEVSRQWSYRVNQEFISQVKQEQEEGLPVQPFLMNLEQLHVMAKSEMGFFKVIVRPLYHNMNRLLDGKLEECIQNLDQTIIEWEKIHTKSLQEQKE